jgi:hypothetical protein
MNRLLGASAVLYEDGYVKSMGEPLSSADLGWIEKKGYDFIETGVRGWGDYNCIIGVRDGMELFTYLAKVAVETVTRVDMVLPRALRANLSNKAYDEGKSESEVVKKALEHYFKEEDSPREH